MKVTRRAILAGSALVFSAGLFLFDFFGSAAGFYSTSEDTPLVVAGTALNAGKSKGSSGAKAPQQLGSVNPLSGVSLDSLKQTIERPLFNQSRAPKPKPEPQVVQEVEEPEASPEDFTLLAVVVADKNPTALLRWNKSNEVYRLKTGQNFSDWTVTEIGPKAIVIKKDELTFPLKLFSQPAPAVSPGAGDQDNSDEDDEQGEAVSQLQQQ